MLMPMTTFRGMGEPLTFSMISRSTLPPSSGGIGQHVHDAEGEREQSDQPGVVERPVAHRLGNLDADTDDTAGTLHGHLEGLGIEEVDDGAEDEPGPREALHEGFTDSKLDVLDLGFDSEVRAAAGIPEDRNDGVIQVRRARTSRPSSLPGSDVLMVMLRVIQSVNGLAIERGDSVAGLKTGNVCAAEPGSTAASVRDCW